MTLNRATAVFAVAIMVLSVLAMPVMATHAGPNINPNAAADEWDGDGTDLVTGFNASADEHSNVTYETEGEADTESDVEDVKLNVSYQGTDYVDYRMSDAELSNGGTTDEGLHVKFTVEHADLERLPGTAGENTTANVTVVELDANGDEISGTDLSFEVDFEYHNERSVVHVQNADDDGAAVFNEDLGVFDSESSWLGYDSSAEVEDTVGIVDENTSVHVYSDDTNVSDEIGTTTEDTESGDRVGLMMASSVEDRLVYVFDGEAGEDFAGDALSASEDSYIVVHSDDHVEINPGSDRVTADDSTVDVYVLANDRPGFGDLRDDLDAGVLGALAIAFGLGVPALTAGGLLITRRRD